MFKFLNYKVWILQYVWQITRKKKKMNVNISRHTPLVNFYFLSRSKTVKQSGADTSDLSGKTALTLNLLLLSNGEWLLLICFACLLMKGMLTCHCNQKTPRHYNFEQGHPCVELKAFWWFTQVVLMKGTTWVPVSIQFSIIWEGYR